MSHFDTNLLIFAYLAGMATYDVLFGLLHLARWSAESESETKA